MQKMKKTIEGGGSKLFICFTSRPSSSFSSAATSASAIRNPSSKSLKSPSRGSATSLNPCMSTSLSRRLRSGSIKGGQSPMFPAAGTISVGGKKKGGAFETAEPSSPKVTCIGQVRVKSKKKRIKVMTKSKSVSGSRSGRREASFRRSEAAASSRWKTVSICDALRSFGSEINCFVPCGWSTCSSRGDEEMKRKNWLMAIKEEKGMGREFVGLVVDERERGLVNWKREVEEEEEEVELQFFEKKKEVEEFAVFGKEGMEEEEEIVNVCVPPRNALLLMRCRSDPVRMAALSKRFWDSPVMKVQEVEAEEEEEVDNAENRKSIGKNVAKEEEGEVGEVCIEKVLVDAADEEVEKEVVLDEEKPEEVTGVIEDKIIVVEEDKEEVEKEVWVVNELEEKQEDIFGEVIAAEVETVEDSKAIDEPSEKGAQGEENLDGERGEDERGEVEIILRRSISCSVPKSNYFAKAKVGGKRRSFSYREKKEKGRHSFSTEREARRPSFSSEKEARRSSFLVDKEERRRWSFSIEKENLVSKAKSKVQSEAQEKKEEVPAATEELVKAAEPKINNKVRKKIQVSKGDESQVSVLEKEKKNRELPECLLLMMYEPKLSVEVSKETWVCSTDFRWRPNYKHPPKAKSKTDTVNDSIKIEERPTEDKNVIEVATANAMIMTPAKAPPTVPSTEQKLVKSLQLPQHFVLTRCKSEPMKSSERLAPDSWVWKSRNQPISTAGIGF